MADMAIECADNGMDVSFITVVPKRPFYSSGGRETLVSLVKHHSNIKLLTTTAGWEFEFGTPAFKTDVYSRLLQKNISPGANIILADDPSVWAVSAQLDGQYNFIGVLHADENHYYDLACQFDSSVRLLVCVSERIKRNLLSRNAGIDSSKVVTISCGIPLPVFQPNTASNKQLEIIYVGRITQYQKRVFDIPAVCVTLKEQGVDFNMSIIGSGDEMQQLQIMVQESGLIDRVNFPGWLQKEQIFEQMRQADVLLLTSDFEGMPVAVMEALSCGCGVVSTRVSGVEDYVSSPFATGCLWLYEVGDVQSAASCLVESRRILPVQKAKQARSLAETEFGIQHCRRRYLDAIDNMRPISETKLPAKKLPVNHTYSLLLSFSRYVRLSLATKFKTNY
ncbi:glycosyltransferase [Polluticoccus soli]|uniref:glycosyltransferase n=1 Tax=Polluticoccus soli TaxID=3034150 RepID=UPI0023E15E6C|nr:glycosyltransferase [Flavipsychrobacter sp. JY13-12]